MLVSFNVKMAIIRLTFHLENMVSVIERIVMSPVILASCVTIGLRTSSPKKMTEDKFAKEMLDKMNHGVSRLSPIAHQLYFSLTSEFLSRSRGNTIKTPLLSYAKYLGITDESIKDISKQIKNAFNEIHTHTFVRYNFEIIAGSRSEKPELFVSVIDNSEEVRAIIERVYKHKNSLH